MEFKVLETDQLFGDSPDTGDSSCLCSRCGLVISEDEVPIRMWPTDAELFPDTPGNVGYYEYRFHFDCMLDTQES